ncbi:MAG: prepilin-type N-terminal cleavage/methylation domain-containing protein [Planctomycetota bacterium]
MPKPALTASRHGFTLIELLVVISIIALLIAILLPSLGAARAAARQSVCAGNMRQLGTAHYGYATDNDNFFSYGYWQVASGGHRAWDDNLDNYLLDALTPVQEDADAFAVPASRPELICPSDTHLSPDTRFIRSYSMVIGRDWTAGFGTDELNGLGQKSDDLLVAPPQYQLENLPDATGTILKTEYSYTAFGGNFQGNRFGATMSLYTDHNPLLSTTGALVLHGSETDPRFNYLFADSHVETLNPELTVDANNAFPHLTGAWTIGAND